MTAKTGGATYRVLLPLDDSQLRTSPRGGAAQSWRRHWKIFQALCKSLKKSRIRYEVEFHFAADPPYAQILAGDACRQGLLPLKKAA